MRHREIECTGNRVSTPALALIAGAAAAAGGAVAIIASGALTKRCSGDKSECHGGCDSAASSSPPLLGGRYSVTNLRIVNGNGGESSPPNSISGSCIDKTLPVTESYVDIVDVVDSESGCVAGAAVNFFIPIGIGMFLSGTWSRGSTFCPELTLVGQLVGPSGPPFKSGIGRLVLNKQGNGALPRRIYWEWSGIDQDGDTTSYSAELVRVGDVPSQSS